MANEGEIVWSPPPQQVSTSRMVAFRGAFAQRLGVPLEDPLTLHAASVREAPAFWQGVLEQCGLAELAATTPVCTGRACAPDQHWFPNAEWNVAEQLLGRPDDTVAIFWADESGGHGELTRRELRERVCRAMSVLLRAGFRVGDRVAAIANNTPEAVVAMLATTALGGTWASCSPDFGADAVVDRFAQLEPRFLFSVARYTYGGRTWEVEDAVADVRRRLPTVEHHFVLDAVRGPLPRPVRDGHARALAAAIADAVPFAAAFARYPFQQPHYCLFTSGTTGPPKALLHGAGGTLLQHLKEHRLHCDIRPGDRVFFHTTTGWMMWNWLVSVLASGASIVLYDGSPLYPQPCSLWRLAAELGVSFFGTSARYLDVLRARSAAIRGAYDLSALRTIASTGSPLLPECFDYVYSRIKRDVHLASISGGTDIVSCFVLGDPTRPVRRGEIQGPGLGMDVRVLDDDGHEVFDQPGELVCGNSFPSMPLRLLGDDQHRRYHEAYFRRYPGFWHHGDRAERRTGGGIVVHGRSDSVLKPGGVRIGTGEIYRTLMRIREITDAVAVGQQRAGDVRVVLCVCLAGGAVLTPELEAKIRATIRTAASPRHVPAIVMQVPEVPRTRNGKLSESAARDAVHGRAPANLQALANPDALRFFHNRSELQ